MIVKSKFINRIYVLLSYTTCMMLLEMFDCRLDLEQYLLLPKLFKPKSDFTYLTGNATHTNYRCGKRC